MKAIKEFIKTYDIKLQWMKVSENPTMQDAGREMNNYFVNLFADGRTDKGMGLFFSMGTGIKHPPTAEEVLECLKPDITIGVSFHEFCSEFGYDEDSRRAEKTYNNTLEQTKKLKAWLGPERFEELEGLDLA